MCYPRDLLLIWVILFHCCSSSLFFTLSRSWRGVKKKDACKGDETVGVMNVTMKEKRCNVTEKTDNNDWDKTKMEVCHSLWMTHELFLLLNFLKNNRIEFYRQNCCHSRNITINTHVWIDHKTVLANYDAKQESKLLCFTCILYRCVIFSWKLLNPESSARTTDKDYDNLSKRKTERRKEKTFMSHTRYLFPGRITDYF